jgi:hypothetical protein
MPTRVAVLCTAAAQKAFDYFRPYIVPNATGVPRLGDAEFIYNPDGGEFDAAVVWQSVAALERTYSLTVPPTRTLLTILEPPDVLTLPDGYTREFAGVLGPDVSVRCDRRFLRGGGHHWFVELTAAEALEQPLKEKPRLISAVVSAKTDTTGHRRRLAFMKALKDHFGDRLDWFGRGIGTSVRGSSIRSQSTDTTWFSRMAPGHTTGLKNSRMHLSRIAYPFTGATLGISESFPSG